MNTAAWLYVVQNASGTHCLTDTLKEGQEPTYQTRDAIMAHRFLQSVNSSRAHHVLISHPAVNGRGRKVITPIDYLDRQEPSIFQSPPSPTRK